MSQANEIYDLENSQDVLFGQEQIREYLFAINCESNKKCVQIGTTPSVTWIKN